MSEDVDDPEEEAFSAIEASALARLGNVNNPTRLSSRLAAMEEDRILKHWLYDHKDSQAIKRNKSWKTHRTSQHRD